MQKVFLFTNIAPLYRQPLWEKLLNSKSFELHIYYGREPGTGFKEIDRDTPEIKKNKSRLINVKNFWFRKKVLIWQSGIISTCLFEKLDISIFTGEMYILSTWLAAIICRLRKVQVVFWGHGIYGNEGKLKLFFRILFYKLAHKHLLYERKGKKMMIENGFVSDKIYVVFNSLNHALHLSFRNELSKLYKEEVFQFFAEPELPVLVFIGRLTVVKKLDILINAIKFLNESIVKYNLLIIGDGSERIQLETIAEEGINSKYIHFTGAIHDEDQTGKYIYFSDLCVSPGNVGLTAIHSLSLGTPVCTHDNLSNQMPEVESINDGVNGCFFKENDYLHLAAQIENWLKIKQGREQIRNSCHKIIDKYYNPDYQISVITTLINNDKPKI